MLMTDFESIRTYKGLKFCHLNVRSIVNKLDQFKLHFEHSSFDVVTLSETWLTEGINDCLLTMGGYQLLRYDRSVQGLHGTKKGGGLLIYVKNDINFSLNYNVEKNLSCSDVEDQRLELTSPVQSDILLFNIYWPPNGSVSKCLEGLDNLLEKETDLHLKDLILLGDFNLNISSKLNAETKKLVQWQNRKGLSQLIKSSTRSSRRSATTIDLIFTSMNDCTNCGVLDLHISDHQPVYAIKKRVKDNRPKVFFKGRTYVNYNKDLLSDCLTNDIKMKITTALLKLLRLRKIPPPPLGDACHHCSG